MIVDFPNVIRLFSSLVLLVDAFSPISADPVSNSGTDVLSLVFNWSGDADDLSTAGGVIATMQRCAIYLVKAMPPLRPSVFLPVTFSSLFIASILVTEVFRRMATHNARYKSLSLAQDVTIALLLNAVVAGIASTVLRTCTLLRVLHTDTPMLHLGIRQLLTVQVLLEAIFFARDFIAESSQALVSAKSEISLNDEPSPYVFDEKKRFGAEQM